MTPSRLRVKPSTEKKPDLNHGRTFGCEAFVQIPKVKRKDKFGERATKGFLMGHERGKSYRVYLPGKKKTIVSRDVTFNEQGSKDILAQNRENGSPRGQMGSQMKCCSYALSCVENCCSFSGKHVAIWHISQPHGVRAPFALYTKKDPTTTPTTIGD